MNIQTQTEGIQEAEGLVRLALENLHKSIKNIDFRFTSGAYLKIANDSLEYLEQNKQNVSMQRKQYNSLKSQYKKIYGIEKDE